MKQGKISSKPRARAMPKRELCSLLSPSLHICVGCIEASQRCLIRNPLTLPGFETNLILPQRLSTTTRVPCFQVPGGTQQSAYQKSPSGGKLSLLPSPPTLPSRQGGVEAQQSGSHSRFAGSPIRPPHSAHSQSFHRTKLPVKRLVGF